MKQTLSFLFICLITANTIASNEYDVNWPKLDITFTAFTNKPDAENLKVIEELLPAGHTAKRKRTFDSTTAIKILNEIGKVEKLINEGNVHALKVAFALTEISDGEYSSWLSVITSSAITKYPKVYLTEIKERMMLYPDPCLDSAILHWEFEGDHVAVLKSRIKAIQAVTTPELEKVKTCVINNLNEYINKPSLQ